MIITDVNTEDVSDIWPLVDVMLARAIDQNQGEFTLDDIHGGLLAGLYRLWLVYEDTDILGVAVCEIRNYARRRICYVLLMAGEGFNDWAWTINSIEEWALDNGADAVAAYTRRGVGKVMQDFEYREVYTVIQKELTDRRLH